MFAFQLVAGALDLTVERGKARWTKHKLNEYVFLHEGGVRSLLGYLGSKTS